MVPFGTLLIGLGQVGSGYDIALDDNVYTHARATSRHPRFRLLGGVDPKAEHRARFAAAYEVPTFSSLAEVPREPDIELVIVASTTAAHGPLVDQALSQFQPRAILCEKPLSYDLTEARAMVEVCDARGVALFVNYVRRADPATLEIKRRIDAGEIRTPLKGAAWYSKGLLHNGSHLVDLLGFWLGPIIEARVIGNGRARGPKDGDPDVRIVFQRGTIVFLATQQETFSHHTIELIAENGRLGYARGGEQVEWRFVSPHPLLLGHSVLSEKPEVLPSGMDRYQWYVAEELAAAIDGLNHHLCSGREAVVTQEHLQSLLEDEGL